MLHMCVYIYIYIYIYAVGSERGSWLRTNGVSTTGADAKVMNFDRLGETKK